MRLDFFEQNGQLFTIHIMIKEAAKKIFSSLMLWEQSLFLMPQEKAS